MINYAALKATAKSIKRPVSELIALAPQNDPFFAERDGRVEWAKWFVVQLDRFGGTHLRRIHYKIVMAPEPVLGPFGKPYQNTNTDWVSLAQAGRDARYLDLIPPNALIDRRNDEPMFFAGTPRDPNEERSVDCEVTSALVAIDYPEMPVSPSFDVTGFDVRQDFLVEV